MNNTRIDAIAAEEASSSRVDYMNYAGTLHPDYSTKLVACSVRATMRAINELQGGIETDIVCICGRMIPCRHSDDPGHSLLSYYQDDGPENGGKIVLETKGDFISARAALDLYARHLGLE